MPYRQHEADPRQAGQMEYDTAMLSATIEELKVGLEWMFQRVTVYYGI